MVDTITSPGANILGQFADIQKSINEAINKAREEREAAASNENLQGPSGDVVEYQKNVNKSSSNLKAFATDVGILVKDTSRLNVIGKLASGDDVDYYKFRNTGTGEAFLGRVGDEGVRVQLINSTGMVIADSNKDSGEALERYDQLTQGKLELQPGELHLRVSRDPDFEPAETGDSEGSGGLNFALQLRMGDYSQDYDTVVNQPDPADDPFAPSATAQGVSSMLNEGYAFFSSYSFGRSGTEKLMGNLFSGVF